MKSCFLEEIQDKSDSGLRSILYAQTKVRLVVALPVMLFDMILMFAVTNGVSPWFLGLSAIYCLYATSPLKLALHCSHSPLAFFLIATAIIDPIVCTLWIILTRGYGSLIAGFYLFTTLGFGFRTGRPLMHLCQAASIAGFTIVYLYDPFWHKTPIIWLAILVPLVIVPLYASKLITTLREARAVAERESRGKSDLLAKVSHELRTPLTGIVVAAELLAEEFPAPRILRRTDTILTLSDNLLCEINDLLDQSKFDSQTPALRLSRVNINEHLTKLCRTFEMMAAKKGLAFRLDIDNEIHDAVKTDAHYLDRILLNLVGNAIKFTESGSIRVSIDLQHKTETDYRLYFGISDTGIGIPDTFRSQIFQAFSQVEIGSERRYGGTGLGLALSKRIIGAMGGELQYSSVPGQGSRFWFELSVPRLAPPARIPAQSQPKQQFVTGKRILVAEDNRTNLMLLQELLEIDHHEVTICTSGIEALELLSREVFDVLLLDYNLGDMDGVRVLQTYRFGRAHASPAIFLTADATAQTATRLFEAGSAAILYKPITLAFIRKALLDLDAMMTTTEQSSGSSVKEMPDAIPTRAVRPTLTVVPVNALDEEILNELKEVSSRPEFLPELLAQAELDIRNSCQRLLDAFANRSYVSIRDTAHALKGVCVNIGAMRLVAVAGNLMNIPSDELERFRDRLTADLRDTFNMTIQSLNKAIAELSPPLSGHASSLQVD
jgi:two-component system sensor histidine kinase RpfC